MTADRESQLLAEIARRDDEIAALKAENRFLQEKIDALVRRIFGASSEKIDPDQMEFEGLSRADFGGTRGQAVGELGVRRHEKLMNACLAS